MKTYIILFIILIFALNGCNNVDYSKDNPYGTLKIDDNLYREIYRTYSGGVCGGDVYTVYLTDSTSFRKYLGKEMDYEQIIVYKFQNKKVLSCKMNSDTYKVIETIIYDISELKKEGKFE